MQTQNSIACALAATMIAFLACPQPAPTCCPAPPPGKPVVNADQTVVIIWDAANKTQHFIRQANFKGEADDFGFIVPSPSQPELEESGNDAFPFLSKLTEPERQKVRRPSGGMGCGCSRSMPMAAVDVGSVNVLHQKQVAGFDAVILEASAAEALVRWLKDHGYAHSPEIEAWAKPYVESGWKFTALKVSKRKDDKQASSVAASALRMSFKTDQPLFPYREPDPQQAATALKAHNRLLRIYLLADARYRGHLTRDQEWTGRVAWANKLNDSDRSRLLELLKLTEQTGPRQWWLTEFEDNWPYRPAPADLTFVRDPDQSAVKRPPIIEYVQISLPTDGSLYALAAVIIVPPIWRRARRKSV
jgi:hypothetical protein